MIVSPLLVAVATSGAAALIFFVSFLVVSGTWHEVRRLNHAPQWYTTRFLVSCNILREKRHNEIAHPKSIAEVCFIIISLTYIALGFVNIIAGLVSVNLVATVRDQTCAYAEQMENLCKIPTCLLACGSINFRSCGILMCNATRCAADLGVFLQAAGDTTSMVAAQNFRDLEGQLAPIQAIASIFGSVSSLLMLAIPSMTAAYRTDNTALAVLMYLSMACAPIYLAFAILVISYGMPLCEPCTARSKSLAYRCDAGLNEGYWMSLCQLSITPMDQCSATLFLSAASLSVECIVGVCAAYIARRYRVAYHIQVFYRKAAEADALSRGNRASDEDSEAATGERRLGAKLVTDNDYMRLPGLLQLYRGHGGAVLCALMTPLRVGSDGEAGSGGGGVQDEPGRLITGGLDGSIRVWDVIEGTCLSVWRAAGPVNALCVFRCKGPLRAQHRQPAVPMSKGRAEWPEQNGQFFPLPAGDVVALWIRVFRRRPDAFRAAAEADERTWRKRRWGGGGAAGRVDGGSGEEGGECCYLELVGGCYFALSEAIKVAIRYRTTHRSLTPPRNPPFLPHCCSPASPSLRRRCSRARPPPPSMTSAGAGGGAGASTGCPHRAGGGCGTGGGCNHGRECQEVTSKTSGTRCRPSGPG
jgi:hypothetical protein